MKIRAALMCIIVSLTSSCALFDPGASVDDSIHHTVTGTDQAVEQFLTGRSLDPIEGAWVHDENSFEIVIAKNTFDVAPGYDYVGIITRSEQPKWEQGDIKLLLRHTDSEGIFEGMWTARNKAKREMTFVVEHPNMIQASFVSNDGNKYFVRIRRMNQRFAGTH